MSCPICERAADKQYHPFCSKRCADVDLGKWLTGVYKFTPQSDDDGEDLAAAITQHTAKPH